VVFEPRLDHGVILDGWTLKDRIRKNDLLRWIVEGFIQPIAAFAHYVLGALVVAWGPFAIAALTGQGNDLGAPPLLSKAALAVLVAQQTGTLLFYLIMALDYNLGTVCLLLRNAKMTLAVNLGTRLLYVRAKRREGRTKHAAEAGCRGGWRGLSAGSSGQSRELSGGEPPHPPRRGRACHALVAPN
jgi:hypothetical protein